MRRLIVHRFIAWSFAGMALDSASAGTPPPPQAYGSGVLVGLSHVDLATGALDWTGLPANLTGLAISPQGGLFGAVGAHPPGTTLPQLARLDVSHGAVAWSPIQGLGVTVPDWQDVGLSFDALGRLWFLTPEGGLFELDAATGSATSRLDLALQVEGLAGCGRSLYTLTHPVGSETPLQLVKIDPDEGTFEAFGPGITTVRGHFGAGLDFAGDGRLFAALADINDVGNPAGTVVEINPRTGELLRATARDGEYPVGLAIAPPPTSCPGGGVVDVPALGLRGLGVLTFSLALAALSALRHRA